MTVISMIVAADERETIGRRGILPWYLPEDLKRFRRLTTGHVVVAGRLTYDSIVDRLGRPLPERRTVVVSRQPSTVDTPDVCFRSDVEAALAAAVAMESDEVFVIGGAEIYRSALPRVTRVHLTRVFGVHDGDTFLDPGWLDGFTLVGRETATPEFQWQTYERA
jgi:dihydrofolate reductase